MKLQLTAKETRKLSTARGLIKSVVEKLPFAAFALETTKAVDNQFTVNPDGSSEFEIHEKSFTAFLEYGSEMFVTVGGIIATAGSEIASAFKEFDQGLTDVKALLLKHNKGFLTQTEIDLEIAEAQAKMNAELAAAREERDKLSAFSPAQVQILKQMLTSDNFADLLKAQKNPKPRIKVLPGDSLTIPYPVRLAAATALVREGTCSSTEAAANFGVKEEDIVKDFPA